MSSNTRDFTADVIAALQEQRTTYLAAGLPVDEIDAELAKYGVEPPEPAKEPEPPKEPEVEKKTDESGMEKAVPPPPAAASLDAKTEAAEAKDTAKSAGTARKAVQGKAETKPEDPKAE